MCGSVCSMKMNMKCVSWCFWFTCSVLNKLVDTSRTPSSGLGFVVSKFSCHFKGVAYFFLTHKESSFYPGLLHFASLLVLFIFCISNVSIVVTDNLCCKVENQSY